MNYAKVKDHPGLARDESTDQIVNTNIHEYQQYVTRREKRKAENFMTRWEFDHVDYTWMDTHHPTIIFYVDKLWNYQIDFADQYYYLNLKKDVLPDQDLYKLLESNLQRKFQPDNAVKNQRSRL